MTNERRERVAHIVEQVVEYQLFDTLAEEFELDGGEWSPEQGIALSRLAEKITALAVEYVEQNSERATA